MARTKPTVINEFPVKGGIIRDVCYSDDVVYAVCYQDRIIKYRQHDPKKRYGSIKYMRSIFLEAAHAVNLAVKLNHDSGSTDYSVWVYTDRGRRKLEVDYTVLPNIRAKK